MYSKPISKAVSKSLSLPDGQELTLETGKVARQSDGAVVLKVGKTMLLATVVAKREVDEHPSFLPLSVDYQERFAAAGKVPGSFLRREGRLSELEILICRLTDRALRPLFPGNYFASTQVSILLISLEEGATPDSLAVLAASAALTLSGIPFSGPISGVRVAKIGEKYCINPSSAQLEEATLSLIVAASAEELLMVEGEAKEASEAELIEALQVAHEAIKAQCVLQKELAQAAGTREPLAYDTPSEDKDLYKKMYDALYPQFYAIAKQHISAKAERNRAFDAVKKEFFSSLSEGKEVDPFLASGYYKKIMKEALRDYTIQERKRIDGRDPDEIRAIHAEVDYLPAAHGSALFTRGETQSLTTVTLGTKLNEQLIDGATVSGTSKYMLHYNFPGFSTGEVKPNRIPSRREIGHGTLALRALKPILPPEEANPYTIRIVSDILESNGSSSMATVCAGSLALMDAGLEVKDAVSGIAMGLLSKPDSEDYVILSDILGDEDQLGDMDFKVAGTAKGITACQMDIKLKGLSFKMLEEALEQAKKGRLAVMEKMNEVLATYRPEYKAHTPRSRTLKIAKDMIGAVIGPAGKVVQELQRRTGATIAIEETKQGGEVHIYAPSEEALNGALDAVNAIVAEPIVGETYNGKVASVVPFGAFVEFMPGKDGLLHISEIKWERLENMEGVLEVGEEIAVKLVDIDKKTKKFRLSRKALLPRPEKRNNT